MKKYLPHIKPALILTPAIFLLAFGVAYSITLFVHEMLHPNE